MILVKCCSIRQSNFAEYLNYLMLSTTLKKAYYIHYKLRRSPWGLVEDNIKMTLVLWLQARFICPCATFSKWVSEKSCWSLLPHRLAAQFPRWWGWRWWSIFIAGAHGLCVSVTKKIIFAKKKSVCHEKCIPDICQFWGTTTIVRPLKRAPGPWLSRKVIKVFSWFFKIFLRSFMILDWFSWFFKVVS